MPSESWVRTADVAIRIARIIRMQMMLAFA